MRFRWGSRANPREARVRLGCEGLSNKMDSVLLLYLWSDEDLHLLQLLIWAAKLDEPLVRADLFSATVVAIKTLCHDLPVLRPEDLASENNCPARHPDVAVPSNEEDTTVVVDRVTDSLIALRFTRIIRIASIAFICDFFNLIGVVFYLYSFL
jgi:hypothetical protein